MDQVNKLEMDRFRKTASFLTILTMHKCKQSYRTPQSRSPES
jgi:hypothetical protein